MTVKEQFGIAGLPTTWGDPLTDEQLETLVAELDRIIDGDRYPLSPRIRALRGAEPRSCSASPSEVGAVLKPYRSARPARRLRSHTSRRLAAHPPRCGAFQRSSAF
jgi:hypothetical protein